MTTHTAALSATVNVYWECRRGRDHDVDVEVEYTFDGDRDIRIQSARLLGEATGIGDYEFDALVDEAVADRAKADYSEWLADQDDGVLA